MNTALLLVDIQNDYFPDGKMELSGALAASLKAKRLLDYFRAERKPLFHIQHISLRPGATFFLPDTEGAKIHANVRPAAGEPVLVKHFPNSFRETPLLEKLRGKDIARLVVAGMMTSMCVDATVRAAFDLGFACIVAHDACATRDLAFEGAGIPAEQVHMAFLSALGAAYAEVLSTEDLLRSFR